jgi:GNAT superfamily N-acetyltransferase
MIVRSLALTTELALAATRGRITDRGDYIVVETPDDPGYYHGNLLVLPAPPQVGEVAYWTRRFADELGKQAAIRHVTLWWDGISGDVGAAAELEAAGFTIDRSVVMAADEVTAPPITAEGASIVALDPDQVLATAELAYAIGDRHDETYREFLQRRARWHRSLVERGTARFWGIFEGRELVASLGLVQLGNLARYQDVQTAVAVRKRGYASALLATAARAAFAAGVERVVILAVAGAPVAVSAERVYTRIGFRIVERTASACRYPPFSGG